MTRARISGAALIVAGGLVLLLAQGPIWRFLRAAGARVDQRPLAGAAEAAPPIARGPVRVVILDGLSLDDTPRLPALARACAGGLDLVVDVGFPTKSLPAQFTLWTGLTSQQAGLSFDNDPMPVPAHAIPAQVPGAIAVVENTRGIAGSFGFAQLLPGPDADADADADADGHDPARAHAWRDRGFADAAVAAVATPSRLVLVHVLAIDDAAHAVGRAGPAYDRALAYADAVLARVAAAVPADASLVVLADHGHVLPGGHGDAERDTRFVRACIAPSPAVARRAAPGIIHLIDLARFLADRTGATLDPDARGRALAVAIANPDPDATLPRPGATRWLVALFALALLLAAAAFALARSGAPAWIAFASLAAPIAAIALAALVPGLPTLSRRPHVVARWLVTALPAAAIAALFAARRSSARAIAIACIAPPFALAIACAILSGAPDALLGGPPARVPIWTGELTFWLAQLAAAACAAGVALFVRPPDRSRHPRRKPAPDPARPSGSPDRSVRSTDSGDITPER